MATDPILYRFLQGVYEQAERRGEAVSQSTVARQSGVSQSLINKIAKRRSVVEPDPATYRAITRAFPEEWAAHLKANPADQDHLLDLYGWALGVPGAAAYTVDPAIAEALEHLRIIVTAPAIKSLVMQQLKAQADYVRLEVSTQRALEQRQLSLRSPKVEKRARVRSR